MSIISSSRPLAAVGLVLAVTLSVGGGSFRAVRTLENKTEKIYTKYDADAGSPKEDIAKIADYAEQLNAVALAAGAQDFTEELSALRDNIASPLGQGDAVQKLCAAASLAYNQITALNAAEQQKTSAKLYYYDLNSAYQRLKNNELYNAAAEKYNGARETLLGGLFADVPATVYE